MNKVNYNNNLPIVNNDASRIELQMVIDNLTRWSQKNRLQLNFDKTKHVAYNKNKINYQSYYYLENKQIATINEFKE